MFSCFKKPYEKINDLSNDIIIPKKEFSRDGVKYEVSEVLVPNSEEDPTQLIKVTKIHKKLNSSSNRSEKKEDDIHKTISKSFNDSLWILFNPFFAIFRRD
jgi:hypothetical protein